MDSNKVSSLLEKLVILEVWTHQQSWHEYFSLCEHKTPLLHVITVKYDGMFAFRMATLVSLIFCNVLLYREHDQKMKNSNAIVMLRLN